MKYRVFGKTNFKASEVSLGTWQLGSKWGDAFDEKVARETLEAAYESGVNLFDTADIYQDGKSENAVGKFVKTKGEKIFVVTKCGREVMPAVPENFMPDKLEGHVEGSLKNMDVEALDMVLLHCPPNEIYYKEEVFAKLDSMKAAGKIKHYGVSVQTVDEAIKSLDYDISAVEIIFNMFRLKPGEEFFGLAKENNVGILARVPLASGLLSGKYDESTDFGANDHRTFNRDGARFDKGETFSGVDYVTGVLAARELKEKLKTDSLALSALKYVLMYDAVSVVIPGASNGRQAIENAKASDMPDLTPEQMELVQQVYDEKIRPLVHHLW